MEHGRLQAKKSISIKALPSHTDFFFSIGGQGEETYILRKHKDHILCFVPTQEVPWRG